MADLTEPRPLTPEEIVRRASMMGLCSQTHHEHLMRDATTVRKATLDAAALSSRPLTPDPLATLLHKVFTDVDGLGDRPELWIAAAARLRAAGVTLTQPQPDAALRGAVKAALDEWNERAVGPLGWSAMAELERLYWSSAALRSTPAAVQPHGFVSGVMLDGEVRCAICNTTHPTPAAPKEDDRG